MKITNETLDELLLLPRVERATLAGELLKSLDEPDPEILAAWIEEAKRRSAAYERGEMESYSEEEVFADLDGRKGS